MYRFWVKIFAIHFAVGVVTGITLEFQFGTNFALFSKAVANIIAPLMAYEGNDGLFFGIGLSGNNAFPGGTGYRRRCTFFLPAWWRSVRHSARSGSWQPMRGCKHRPVILSKREHSSSLTSIVPFFLTALFTHLSHMLIASYETTAFAVAGIRRLFSAQETASSVLTATHLGPGTDYGRTVCSGAGAHG